MVGCFQDPYTDNFDCFRVRKRNHFGNFQGPENLIAFLDFSGALKCHVLTVECKTKLKNVKLKEYLGSMITNK